MTLVRIVGVDGRQLCALAVYRGARGPVVLLCVGAREVAVAPFAAMRAKLERALGRPLP